MMTRLTTTRGHRLAASAAAVALALVVAAPAVAAVKPKTIRVSVASDGTQHDEQASEPSISGSGRFIAFQSNDPDLDPDVDNGSFDVYVHDRKTRTTTRISVAPDGSPGDGDSGDASISADGRFVAFKSTATNLVPEDTDDIGDIFVRDRVTGVTTLVSVRSNGAKGDGPSEDPKISANGRYVVFESRAANLVPDDGNFAEDVFVHDRRTGKTTLVSRRSDGVIGNEDSGDPSISSDGRYVAFGSDADNLAPKDKNDSEDIFLHDRKTKKTILVSRTPKGAAGNGESEEPSISADGRFVAYESTASNLVGNDRKKDLRDIFVYSVATGKNVLVSRRSNGRQGNGDSQQPYLSANGRWVVFESEAALAAKDGNGLEDVYLHDRQTGKTILISRRPDGAASATGESDDARISGDGRFVAFESEANDLVKNDTNGSQDIFRRGPLR
jgi:Tol biopolymer transport system component